MSKLNSRARCVANRIFYGCPNLSLSSFEHGREAQGRPTAWEVMGFLTRNNIYKLFERSPNILSGFIMPGNPRPYKTRSVAFMK